MHIFMRELWLSFMNASYRNVSPELFAIVGENGMYLGATKQLQILSGRCRVDKNWILVLLNEYNLCSGTNNRIQR